MPTYGKPHMRFACNSGWPLMFHIGRNHPEIKRVWTQFDVRTYRQAARQDILEQAYTFGATYLLMLDDDHVFFPETFDKLWSVREEAPIVGALYVTRSTNPVPCIFKITGPEGTTPIFFYEQDKVIDVDVIGFGFLLINLKILDLQIPDVRKSQRGLPQLFNLGTGFGEDAAFSARFLHAGIPTKCHTGAQIGHIVEDPQIVWPEDFIRERPRIIEQMGKPKWIDGGVLPPEHAILGKMGAKPFWRPHATSHWYGGKVPGTERSPQAGEEHEAKEEAKAHERIDQLDLDTKL